MDKWRHITMNSRNYMLVLLLALGIAVMPVQGMQWATSLYTRTKQALGYSCLPAATCVIAGTGYLMRSLYHQRQQDLLNAVRANKTIMVNPLLKQMHPVDGQDNEGNTPLMHAIFHNNSDLVRLLCEDGQAPLETKNKAGETALLCAIHRLIALCISVNHLEDCQDHKQPITRLLDIIVILLEHKADTTATNKKNRSAHSMLVQAYDAITTKFFPHGYKKIGASAQDSRLHAMSVKLHKLIYPSLAQEKLIAGISAWLSKPTAG